MTKTTAAAAAMAAAAMAAAASAKIRPMITKIPNKMNNGHKNMTPSACKEPGCRAAAYHEPGAMMRMTTKKKKSSINLTEVQQYAHDQVQERGCV